MASDRQRFEGGSELEGKFLIAMPGMGDARFERSVIFVCAHSQEGAMGFMVNRPLESPTVEDFFMQLNIVEDDELEELVGNFDRVRLYSGGPVEPGRGFVLHSGDYNSQTTLRIGADVALTATLEILRAIATGQGPRHILLALGYAGWTSGQLEQEIAANGWLTCAADTEILFDANDKSKYDRALASLGIDQISLSGDAGHA